MQQQRIDSRQGRPLGTAMRQGTAVKGVGGLKGDFNFNMNIMNRPITNHGIVGVKGLNQGGGRQVVDRTYVLTMLRQKINDIYSEINKCRTNIDDIARNNQQFLQLERKYEELAKDVRNQEGTLADYNLALDKQRSNTRPEDIQNMYEYIKMQNERLRAQLDDIFIERKQQEEEINAIEFQLKDIDQQMEMRLNELDPDQKNDYQKLLNEKRSLGRQIDVQRSQLEQINARLMQAESSLRMDINKVKAQKLTEQMKFLSSKKEDLEIQLNEANLSFPEARDRLLARIKNDNAFILQEDKRVKDVQKQTDMYEKRIREIEDDTKRADQMQNDNHKFEILHQRDQEMSEFIENFETIRRNELNGIQSLEQRIVEIMEQTSKLLALNGALPTKEEFKELENDLRFKQGQTENAEKTLQMLHVEFEKRNGDLKKLDQAEERVMIEINNLNEKIEKMNDEIVNKFNKANDVKKDFANKKNQLLQDQKELKSIQNKISDEMKQIAYDQDLQDTKYTRHENYKLYHDLEKRMSQNEQHIYQLKTYISTKSKDMNYNSYKNESIGLIQELNQVLLS